MDKMKTFAFASILIVTLALFGCSPNNNQQDENSHLIRVCGMCIFYLGQEPLVVQVSEGSKAYIWQFSNKMVAEGESLYGGKDAPVSTLGEVTAQATLYKQAQDQQNKPAPVVILGDDQAKCGAVFEAIANAKHAGITAFYFETYYRESGKTGPMTSWEGPVENPTYSVNLSGKSVTITISADNTIAWENKQGTLQDYVNHLLEIRDAAQSGNIHFIVEANAQTNFNALRYALDQIRRLMSKSVTVELRETK